MKDAKSRVTIDTANPGDRLHSVFADPIGSHDRIAGYYKARPPYRPEFFRTAAEKMRIDGASVLLDLCCGTGILADGFSPHAGTVYGVDGSAAMLEHAVPKDNIRYFRHDVNAEALSLPLKASHLVIGDAVWYLKSDSLLNILRSNVENGGKVLVAHTRLMFSEQPYANALNRVLLSYRKDVADVDFKGEGILQKCGYAAADNIRMRAGIRFGIDFLILNQLSYAYRDFYETTHANIEKYRADMTAALTPFLENGQISATLINAGIVYAPA